MKRALIAIVILAGCGGSSPKASAPPPTSAEAGGLEHRADAEDPRIVELDQQIGDAMNQLGLEPASDDDVVEATVAHRTFEPMSSASDQCDAAPASACSEVCTFADSICHNAERICDLAAELDNSWAMRRCTAGRLSCERARDRCCGC